MRPEDFDRRFSDHFNRVQKHVETTRKIIGIGSVLIGLFWMGVIGGVVYVAHHFLSKFW